MSRALWAKIVFWGVILASCAWLLLASIIALRGMVWFFANGFKLTERSPLEILIFVALTLQPAVVLFLIIRAIQLRDFAQPLRTIAKAIYPLALVVLLIGDSKSLGYLNLQSQKRMVQRWNTGSITYVCSTTSRTADYHSQTIGPIELRLTEFGHPGKLGTWIVTWPGKKPIKAASFQSRTGSIGGSQGINWHEADGRPMIAYLSFSDLVSQLGSSGMWVTLVQSDARISELGPAVISHGVNFICGPDPTSYHE